MIRKGLGLAACLLLLAAAAPAQKLFLWGDVNWQSGVPANGLEIRLLKGTNIRARAYTNPAGRYAFFDQAGAPAEYILQVLSAGKLLKQAPVGPQVGVGGRVANVVVP